MKPLVDLTPAQADRVAAEGSLITAAGGVIVLIGGTLLASIAYAHWGLLALGIIISFIGFRLSGRSYLLLMRGISAERWPDAELKPLHNTIRLRLWLVGTLALIFMILSFAAEHKGATGTNHALYIIGYGFFIDFAIIYDLRYRIPGPMPGRPSALISPTNARPATSNRWGEHDSRVS